MQRACTHADELCGEAVALVSFYLPAFFFWEPSESIDLGVKERVVVETKLLPDVAAVGPDLGSVRVLFGRHVAGFLE